MKRHLTHAFSRKSVSLFVSSRPHPQSPSPALRPGRSTRPTSCSFERPGGGRRRRRRLYFRPVAVPASAVPAAALPFCLDRVGLGRGPPPRRVSRRRRTREAHPGTRPPGTPGTGRDDPVPSPPRTRASASLPPGSRGPRPPPASASCFSRRNAPGRYFCTSSWFTYPARDSDGLAHGPVRARRGLDDALGDVLAESGGHRARGRPTRRSRGVRHRGGARRSAPRERDVLRGRDARVDVRARSRRALARRGRFPRLSWFSRRPFSSHRHEKRRFSFSEAYLNTSALSRACATSR